ncbi:hypothetical protein DM02DRAFT_565028 [Periconia macrospinosa]|uniref:Uncharacterized protein n=1 Tax=Periconia macrospinosa TaxID=97972 RepID=A0A2V1DPI6_9PLEO|nr:hypothetical protein DM02DRAFT_565028 [Periconia macrospinosa]
MLDHFALRHLPPLLLGTVITFGGAMSLTSGPEAALAKFGFRDDISHNKAAWPVIKIQGSRMTSIGLAVWGLYLGGHLEAIDILLATFGWMAVIDGIVCSEHGRPGSVLFRMSSTSLVALWGLLGMTTGRFI